MSTELKSSDREKIVQLIDIRGRLQFELQQLIAIGASSALIAQKNTEIQGVNSRISDEARTAENLDAKAILDTLVETNVSDAMKAINCTKDKVTKAVEKINSIRRVFQYIDLFIRLGAAIVGAAATGSPAAQIKAIIDSIDTLYQTDFSVVGGNSQPCA